MQPKVNMYNDCPTVVRDFLFYMQTIKGRSTRTVEAYYIDLRHFLRYLKTTKLLRQPPDELSELPFDDLTTEFICGISLSDVYGFLNYVQTIKINNAATRSRKVSAIRSLYKYLNTKTQYLPENPVKDLEVPTIRKSMPKYLTLDESLELLARVGGEFVARDFCILTLFLNCGMRLSELVSIKLQDIRDNTVKLLGKGNKERIIYLNQACIDAIAAYLKVREKPKSIMERDILFLSSRGTQLTPRRVEQIVEAALKAAGLDGKGYSPHKLRHTAATLMYQHGNVDIRVLKEILGHVNLGTTEIYTHVSSAQLENAANLSPLSKITPAQYQKKKKQLPDDES